MPAEEGVGLICIGSWADEPTGHYPPSTRADLDETAQLVTCFLDSARARLGEEAR